MCLSELLDLAEGALKRCGVPEYALEARLLLESCLGKTRTELFLLGQSAVNEEDEARYLGFIERRKQREPIAYILGEQEFWSMRFVVTPAVLIPRPETEYLLDRVLTLVSQENLRGNLLDLCCGSGVIATVIAKETGKKVLASDISFPALEVTKSNLRYHGLEGQVQLVHADLFSAFRPNRTFSLIVSNPPYVSSIDIDQNLEPEVADYEPRVALDGGDAGMDFLAKIRQEVPQRICPGGQIFVEIGADQGDAVRTLFTKKMRNSPNFATVDILVDYAGRDRVLHATMEQ